MKGLVGIKALPVFLALVLIVGLASVTQAGDWPWGWSRPTHVADADRAVSDLALAPCPLTGLIFFVTPDGGTSRALTGGHIDGDGSVTTTGPVLDLPGDVHVSHVQLAPASGGFHLVWLERQGGSFRLMYMQLGPQLAPSLPGPVEVTQVESVLRDPFLASDPGGRAWIAWADMELGRHSLVLTVVDGGQPASEAVRVTGTAEADIMPSLVVDDAGSAHLTWLRQEGEMWSLMYRSLAPWPGIDELATLRLGAVSGRQSRPTPMGAAGGSIHVAWIGQVGGRGGGSGLIYTEIDPRGGRIVQSVSASPPGSSPSDPSLVVPFAGRVSVAWVEASGDRSVVHAARLTLPGGDVSEAGPAVRMDGDTVRPTLVAVPDGHVLLFVRTVTADNLYRVHVVSDRDPASPDLAYWLGLSPTSPWGDLLFRLVAGLVTSAVAATLRTFTLAAGIAVVMLLDRLAPGKGLPLSRIILLLSVLFLLKEPGNPIFHAATVWMAPYEWLSFIISSLVALGLCRLSGLAHADVLGYLLAGFTFLAVDAFLGAAPATTNIPYFLAFSPDAGALQALRIQKALLVLLALALRLAPGGRSG